MPDLELSIIIISYNTKRITENCIKSILSSTKKTSYEIIVLDNGSRDGSIQMLERLKNTTHNLKVIINKDNAGFGKANNQGIKLATSDYILFLNSDTEVLEDGVDKLATFYKEHEKEYQFVGGKLFNKDMSPQASAGPEYSLLMIFAHLFLRGDYWGLTRSSPSTPTEVDWVSGACIMTKKEHMEKIKGFDEQIFMYMDEIDLLYRAKKKGMKVFFYPEAKFIHLGSASSGSKTYPILQVFRGLMYFYQKNRSKSAQIVLKSMLKLKAAIGLVLGYSINNKYLKETYGKAFQIVTLA